MDQTSNSNVFRTKAEPVEAEVPKAHKENVPVGAESKEAIEPPFTDYEKMNKYPFLVDYYKLGDSWQEKMGGFEKEITLIEGYFKDKIEQGKMRNETSLVREEIDKMYKLNKIDKSERTTMQIERLAAYVEFLKRTDKIELDRFRYR